MKPAFARLGGFHLAEAELQRGEGGAYESGTLVSLSLSILLM